MILKLIIIMHNHNHNMYVCVVDCHTSAVVFTSFVIKKANVVQTCKLTEYFVFGGIFEI